MNDTIDRELARLRAFIAENGLTLMDVSRMAEPPLAYSTVHDALKEGANPRIQTVRALLAMVPPDFVPKREDVS